MFGDAGHACLMLAASGAMIFWEKKLKRVRDELFQMAFYGRYIMLMMAIFSMYTGPHLQRRLLKIAVSIQERMGMGCSRRLEGAHPRLSRVEGHLSIPLRPGLDVARHGKRSFVRKQLQDEA